MLDEPPGWEAAPMMDMESADPQQPGLPSLVGSCPLADHASFEHQFWSRIMYAATVVRQRTLLVGASRLEIKSRHNRKIDEEFGTNSVYNLIPQGRMSSPVRVHGGRWENLPLAGVVAASFFLRRSDRACHRFVIACRNRP